MNDLKNSDLLKSHLIIKINFKFSADSDEEHVMIQKVMTQTLCMVKKKIKFSNTFSNHFFVDIKKS